MLAPSFFAFGMSPDAYVIHDSEGISLLLLLILFKCVHYSASKCITKNKYIFKYLLLSKVVVTHFLSLPLPSAP